MSWLFQNSTTLSCLSHTAETIRGRWCGKNSLTVTTPLPVEQTGVAVIPPFHGSVVGHAPFSTVATQQGVYQDLQAQTSTSSACVTVGHRSTCWRRKRLGDTCKLFHASCNVLLVKGYGFWKTARERREQSSAQQSLPHQCWQALAFHLNKVIQNPFFGHVTVEREVGSEMVQERVQVQRVVAVPPAVDALTPLQNTHNSFNVSSFSVLGL